MSLMQGEQTGVELRDWLAANATEKDIHRFQNWRAKRRVSGTYTSWPESPSVSREVARYRYADAMLKARESTP